MPSLANTGPEARRWLLVAGIVLVAVNLRPGLASVGPLVPDIRASTGLANAWVGALTTLPLLAFACVSVFTSMVTRRMGMERAVFLALTLLTAGTALRAAPSIPALYGGTVVMGVGIALANVLLPSLTKRDFAARSGPITSLYSSMMGLGATVAAGMSVPIAAELGWRGALGVWVVPGIVAMLLWLPHALGGRPRPRAGDRAAGFSVRMLGRSRLAWSVALYMGLQSLTFYVVIAWLPDLLHSHGIDEVAAGWLLALSQAMGVLGTAVMPVWAGRRVDQRQIIFVLGALEALGLGGLLLPGGAFATLFVSLLGFVLGGTFGLVLTLLVLRAPDAESAGALSGMAQSVGYMVAALGPPVFGLLHDVSHGWVVPLLFLITVLAAKVRFGLQAGREGVLEAHGAL